MGTVSETSQKQTQHRMTSHVKWKRANLQSRGARGGSPPTCLSLELVGGGRPGNRLWVLLCLKRLYFTLALEGHEGRGVYKAGATVTVSPVKTARILSWESVRHAQVPKADSCEDLLRLCSACPVLPCSAMSRCASVLIDPAYNQGNRSSLGLSLPSVWEIPSLCLLTCGFQNTDSGVSSVSLLCPQCPSVSPGISFYTISADPSFVLSSTRYDLLLN